MTKPAKPLVLARTTPMKSAELFLATRPNLIYQQGEWLDYKGGAYYPVEDDVIKSQISYFADGAVQMIVDSNGKRGTIPFHPKPADVKAIRDMLQGRVQKAADTMAPPCWLDGREGLDPQNIISCKNGLLDITTRQLHEPTPAFFTRTVLPIEYQPDAPEPTQWLAFLYEVTHARPRLIQTIREMMGYMISADTSQQRVFYFFGEPRSGKGTIMRILGALIGNANVAYSSIETLGGRFGLIGLVGKSGLFITEMNSSNENISAATSRINAISGEDNVSAERKGREEWSGKLGCRILVASNNLPTFGQHVDALMTRLLVVPFDVSFAGREDRQLTSKLTTELPGILNWALDGLETLRLCGEFEEPAESKEIKTRMRHISEPLLGFIEARCIVGQDERVGKNELYNAYRAYCAECGHHPLAKNKFTERLRTQRKGIVPARGRDGEERSHFYKGVSLRPIKQKLEHFEE
jgi:putative DNA primase/helicase